MPFLGWLEYDGIEVVCDERAVRYAEQYGCGDGVIRGELAGLGELLGTQFGQYPADDPPAPWYDAAEAAAGEVLGVLGLALEGLPASPRTRAVTPAVAGDGGVASLDRAGPREVEARLAVVATTERGCAYAVNWLAQVFTHGRAQPAGDAAEDGGRPPYRWGNTPYPGGRAPALRLLAEEPVSGEDLRWLFDTVLTEGPAVEARYALDDARVWEVALTLTAGAPYLWAPPRPAAAAVPFARWPHAYGTAGNDWVPASERPIRWVMTRDRAAAVRGTDADEGQCNADPIIGCPGPIAVPPPAGDVDPCAATTPMVPTWAALCDTAAAGLPRRAEVAPVIVVETGGALMRRLSIRIGRRLPGGQHDPTGLGLRWEINVPVVPAHSRLVLDGRNRSAVVQCLAPGDAGEAADAPAPAYSYEPAVYGIRSTPVVWPVFQGGEDLRITAHAEDDYCSPGARVWCYLAPRADTA